MSTEGPEICHCMAGKSLRNYEESHTPALALMAIWVLAISNGRRTIQEGSCFVRGNWLVMARHHSWSWGPAVSSPVTHFCPCILCCSSLFWSHESSPLKPVRKILPLERRKTQQDWIPLGPECCPQAPSTCQLSFRENRESKTQATFVPSAPGVCYFCSTPSRIMKVDWPLGFPFSLAPSYPFAGSPAFLAWSCCAWALICQAVINSKKNPFLLNYF